MKNKSTATIRRPSRPLARRRPRLLAQAKLHAVADLFSVLSEPSLLIILQILQAGPASVGELVEQSGLKQANVSKQLGILLRAGVIARNPEGNKVFYAIAMPMVFQLCDLVCQGVAQHASHRAAALR